MKCDFKREQGYKIFTLLLLLMSGLYATAQENQSIDIIELDTLTTTPSTIIQSFEIDTAFSNKVYRENFKLIPSKINIYDVPYSVKDNFPNYKRLAINTAVLYGAGFVTLGVLHSLPEDATSWNKKEIMDTPPFKRWWRNVKKGPVIDKDNAMFNYILHPYGGAVYYMTARSQGFNLFYSSLYAAAISTFFWEYGIEAFMEVPSIQDLTITPIAGTIVGEGFYRIKRYIVDNDYKFLGSKILGNVIAFVVDPVNEVVGLFAGNPSRKKHQTTQSSLACIPWVATTENTPTYGFTISFLF